MLEYYYSVEHKDRFNELFGLWKIGKNPTKERNSYLTMIVDFGSLNIGGSFEHFEQSMNDKINETIKKFIDKYQDYGKDISAIDAILKRIRIYPNDGIMSFTSLTNAIENSPFNGKFYLLIDEYDAALNHLFTRDSSQLLEDLKFDEKKSKEAVNKESSFRRFFSAIKQAKSKAIGRVYITGVSSICLDGFTSGFNISEDISGDPIFSTMCGFTKDEIFAHLEKMNTNSPIDIPAIMEILTKNYDGYKFHKNQKLKIYNPTLCSYFFKILAKSNSPPEELMDPNMRPSFSILSYASKTKKIYEIMESLIPTLQITTKLTWTRRFSSSTINDHFNDDNFLLSLLYYNGALTYSDSQPKDKISLSIPNLVMEKEFFQEVEKFMKAGEDSLSKLSKAINHLTKHLNIQPLCDYVYDHYLRFLRFQDVDHSLEQDVKLAFFNALKIGLKLPVHIEFPTVLVDNRGQADLVIESDPVTHLEFKNIKFDHLNKNGILMTKYIKEVENFSNNGWERDAEICRKILVEPDENKIMQMEIYHGFSVKDKWEEVKKQTKENHDKIKAKDTELGIKRKIASQAVLRIGLYRLKAEIIIID